MAISSKVLEILSRAEADIRVLIQEQLSQGLYGEVVTTAQLADSLLRLAHGQEDSTASGGLAVDLSGNSRSGIAALPEPPRRRPARDYPLFLRDGDRLVKIAWSKRERAEYEHRAPQRVIQILIDTVRKKKGEGKLFEATDILPMKDSATRQEIPSYQAYLALAWLRHVGLVSKKGRAGYVLKAAASPERVAELWEVLPVSK